MPSYTPPVKRRNHGRGHSYVDAEGRKVPGVTTVTDGGVPKPALIKWSADKTIEYAIDHWGELSALPVSERIKRLSRARFDDKDAAAKRGTEVHRYGERIAAGETVTPPDEIADHVAAYASFCDRWDVQPIYIECVVVSHRYGYAGTFDLIAELRHSTDPDPDMREVWLLDLKTSRSGVFGETALQLAAYRYADVMVDYRDAECPEYPMPPVDRCGVVHIRPDGAELYPLTVGGAQHRQFLYAQQIARFCESSRELVGEPLTPPVGVTG